MKRLLFGFFSLVSLVAFAQPNQRQNIQPSSVSLSGGNIKATNNPGALGQVLTTAGDGGTFFWGANGNGQATNAIANNNGRGTNTSFTGTINFDANSGIAANGSASFNGGSVVAGPTTPVTMFAGGTISNGMVFESALRSPTALGFFVNSGVGKFSSLGVAPFVTIQPPFIEFDNAAGWPAFIEPWGSAVGGLTFEVTNNSGTRTTIASFNSTNFGFATKISATNGLYVVSGGANADTITNRGLANANLIGSDANGAEVAITVGSGLSLSGGILTGTGGGGSASNIVMRPGFNIQIVTNVAGGDFTVGTSNNPTFAQITATNGINVTGGTPGIMVTNPMGAGGNSILALTNGGFTADSITNRGLTNSKLVGTDANTPPAETSINISSGLSLSGGNLSATVSGALSLSGGNISSGTCITNGDTRDIGVSNVFYIVGGPLVGTNVTVILTNTSAAGQDITLVPGSPVGTLLSLGGVNGLSNRVYTVSGSNDVTIAAGYQTNDVWWTNGMFFIQDQTFLRNSLGVGGAFSTTNGGYLAGNFTNTGSIGNATNTVTGNSGQFDMNVPMYTIETATNWIVQGLANIPTTTSRTIDIEWTNTTASAKTVTWGVGTQIMGQGGTTNFTCTITNGGWADSILKTFPYKGTIVTQVWWSVKLN